MNKAVIYARVSSKEQEQSGFSIPAQIKYLSEYAQRQGLLIVQTFSESMSAKEEGARIEFDNMFKFLKKNKDIQHIIVEKNDRLLRNDFDSAKIIKIATTTDLTFHLAKENMILNKNSTPQDILFFTINSAFSSYYPRNLSREVKKGMIEKAEQGYFPQLAPFGYKNKRESRKHSIIITDDEKAPIVKRVFKLYSTGSYSIRGLARKITEEGYYHNKKPCTKIFIEKILKNPFYMGEFEFAGKRYSQTQHEALISKLLFYTCKDIRESGGSVRGQTKDFLYRGLIKCQHCGGVLSAELKHGANKSGEYIYYRCTRAKERGCKTKALKAVYIDEFIVNILKQLDITENNKNLILNLLKNKYIEQTNYDEKATEQNNKQIEIFKNRLNKIYIDRLDGLISDNDYFDKKEEWQIELDKLETYRENLKLGMQEFMRKADNFLELCKDLYLWYFKQNNEEKRNFLNLIISNFFYDGLNLHIELKSALETMFKNANLLIEWAGGANARTFVDKLYQEINNPDNIILFEKIKLFLAA